MNSEDMYAVVERFRSVQDLPGVVDMEELELGSGCRTVACMAGWYHVAKCQEQKLRPRNWAFLAGIKALRLDLGFNCESDLAHWAKNNPRIWGNASGYKMFNNKVAYGIFEGEITVRHIADHLEKVAHRLKEQEDEVSG